MKERIVKFDKEQYAPKAAGNFVSPMFNVIDEDNNCTSLYLDGTIAFNNWEVDCCTDSYLKPLPKEIVKEWEVVIQLPNYR